MKTNNGYFWAWTFLPAVLGAAETATNPNELLRRALVDPPPPFEGLVTITHWIGTQTRTEEAHVFMGGPGLYRCEYMTPTGTVARVVVTRDGREWVWTPEHGRAYQGGAPKSLAAGLPPEEELSLLLRNYRAEMEDPDEVAGRAVWIIHLTPKNDGKPDQRIAVDRSTGVLLESRRSLHGSPNAVAIRFLKFSPDVDFPPNFFDLDLSSASFQAHDYAPPILNREELNRQAPGTAWPSQLAGGYVFQSGHRMTVQGRPVAHAGYTDGLALVSFFQTDRPVRDEPLSLTEDTGALHFLTADMPTRVLHGKRGNTYWTLVGDGSEALLESLWNSFP